MAMIFPGYRSNIARRMVLDNENDEAMKWFRGATFAKTSTGHWLAWHADSPDRFAVLLPDHPAGQPCEWFESWDSDYTAEKAIDHIESGRYEREPPGVLNLFIKNEATGEWE